MPLEPSPTNQSPAAAGRPADDAEAEILRIVRSLRFGSVEIQIHEGRVVQIERRERQRFDSSRHH